MKNILIVEDTKMHQEKIKNLITEMGHNIAGCFEYGERAVEYVKEQQCPDLIIIDIILKGEMNGYETARLINCQATVPIIFLTGMEDDLKNTEMGEIGAFVYLNKPYTKQELKNNIEMVLYKDSICQQLMKNIEEKQLLLDNIDVQIWKILRPIRLLTGLMQNLLELKRRSWKRGHYGIYFPRRKQKLVLRVTAGSLKRK